MYTQQLKSGKVRFFEKYKNPINEKWQTVSIVMPNGSNKSKKQAAQIFRDLYISLQKLSKTFIYEVSILATLQKHSKIYTQKLHFGYMVHKNFLKKFMISP